MKVKDKLKLQTLVWQDPLGYLSKVSLMKLLHFGIERQKYFLDPRFTAQVLISGLLDAFFLNLLTENLSSMVKVKSDKSLKSSSALVPQMNNCGKVLYNYQK